MQKLEEQLSHLVLIRLGFGKFSGATIGAAIDIGVGFEVGLGEESATIDEGLGHGHEEGRKNYSLSVTSSSMASSRAGAVVIVGGFPEDGVGSAFPRAP